MVAGLNSRMGECSRSAPGTQPADARTFLATCPLSAGVGSAAGALIASTPGDQVIQTAGGSSAAVAWSPDPLMLIAEVGQLQ